MRPGLSANRFTVLNANAPEQTLMNAAPGHEAEVLFATVMRSPRGATGPSILPPTSRQNQTTLSGMTGASRAADPPPARYFVLLKSGLRFSWNAAMPSRALAVQAERPKAL